MDEYEKNATDNIGDLLRRYSYGWLSEDLHCFVIASIPLLTICNYVRIVVGFFGSPGVLDTEFLLLFATHKLCLELSGLLIGDINVIFARRIWSAIMANYVCLHNNLVFLLRLVKYQSVFPGSDQCLWF